MSAEERTTAHFDKEASTWNDSPVRRQLTIAISDGIKRVCRLLPDMRVLEYGCGTAALGFLLAGSVSEVVAADASSGMIDQVRRKLTDNPKARLTPLLLDLTQPADLSQRFDLIVTAMTMHHIADTAPTLSRLVGMLVENGWLAIADLCLEDGTFHAPRLVPHNGFEPDGLVTVVRNLGMVDCQWQIVHRIEKNGRPFDVFLLTARRIPMEHIDVR